MRTRRRVLEQGRKYLRTRRKVFENKEEST